jgi:hypothetical protein
MVTKWTILFWLILIPLLFKAYQDGGSWIVAAVLLVAIRTELMGIAMWTLGRILHEKQVLNRADIERVVRGKE